MDEFQSAFDDVLAQEPARQSDVVAKALQRARWKKMVFGLGNMHNFAVLEADLAALERRVLQGVGIHPDLIVTEPPRSLGAMAELYEAAGRVDLAVRERDRTAMTVVHVVKNRTAPNKNDRVYLAGCITGRYTNER